jgi:hypothetical protein
VWIEFLRVDPVNDIFGVRLNVWTSILVFAAAALYFVVSSRRHPGRETDVEPAADPTADGSLAESAGDGSLAESAEDGEGNVVDTSPERSKG